MTYLNDLPAKTLIIPMGLPASGKSTFYRGLKDIFNEKVLSVSFDNALEALAEKEGVSYAEAFTLVQENKDAKRFADAHYKQQMEAALFHQGIVFIDQTNLTTKGRESLMKKFNGFYSVGVQFDISVNESKRRCAQRFIKTGKKIENYVVERMANTAANNPVNPNDFDMFIVIDTSKQLRRYESINNMVKGVQYKNTPRP